jgi:uncharacterized protein YecE (DUF72 family)
VPVPEVRIGLCGFTMAFADYVREFPVVEVQQTFYQPPGEATLRRWRRMAPPRFEFTLKAWQLITHEASSPTYRRLRQPLSAEQRRACGGFRATPVVLAAWERTVACAGLLSASAVLLQCPRSFRPTPENAERMRSFFAAIERPERLRVLWEPRGPWPPELVRELCSELDLAHVVDPLTTTTVTPERTYLRLHGVSGARHVHTDAELAAVRDALPPGGTAYVMFNNLPRIGDARRFAAVVAAS